VSAGSGPNFDPISTIKAVLIAENRPACFNVKLYESEPIVENYYLRTNMSRLSRVVLYLSKNSSSCSFATRS